MSDQSMGPDWWMASDGKWYPPQAAAPPPPPPGQWAGPNPVAYVQQKTNGLAIASMVLGILWLWWIGSILALVFGYVARNQIDQSEGTQSGRGMAIAGIVLGWVGIVGVLAFVLLFWFLGSSTSTSFSSTGSAIN